MTSGRPNKQNPRKGDRVASSPPSSDAASPVPAGDGTVEDASSGARNTNNSCYLVTVGLCAHVRAENAESAAVAAVDAATGAAPDSGRSPAAQIGTMCVCSVPAEKRSSPMDDQREDRFPRQQQHEKTAPQQQHEKTSPQQQLQQNSHQLHRPSYCAIHVDGFRGGCTGSDVADAAATEAVIGAVARAAAAEVSLGVNGAPDSCSTSPQRCSLCSVAGGSCSELRGIVGVDMPDMKAVPIAIRVPSYGEHLLYELKKLRRFWRFDLHQRDWRQILVCSYFPNVIDPLLLTLLRLCCCICVGALEVISSIQGVQEIGGSHVLYFTNWNSVLVAVGFISLTITSIIACRSFAAPLHVKPPPNEDQQPQQQQAGSHPRTDLLMKPIEDSRTSGQRSQHHQQNQLGPQCRVHSRENSTSSLGFSPLEFVAINDNLPHPTYSNDNAGLLPRLVQLRQQLLQQQQEPRDTRALCLVLPGYRDLMADSRYCIEGILLAPNPSNRAKPKQQQSVEQKVKWYSWLCCRRRKASKVLTSPSASASAAASAAATAPSGVAASSSSAAIPTVFQAPTAGETPIEESRSSFDFSIAPSTAAAMSTVEAPMPWFVKVTWVLHNLQLVASMGVFAVFFSLFKSEDSTYPWTWITIWKHAVLVMLTLLHASLLSRIPCPLRHVGFTLILFVFYFSLQICVYVFQLSNGQGGVGYVYKVFTLAEPGKAVVVLLGVLLCCLFMHLFLWSISRKRCLYVDPPLSVSVTALQLKRSIRYAAAAAAAAAAAERIASESAAVTDSASQEGMVKMQQRTSQYSTEEMCMENQLSSRSSSRNSSDNTNGPSARQKQAQQQHRHPPSANFVEGAQT